jgi:hypothetical protein
VKEKKMASTPYQLVVIVCVFCCTAFLYMHVRHHRKVVNLAEVLVVQEAVTPDVAEDVCNTRQPAVFERPVLQNVASCAWFAANGHDKGSLEVMDGKGGATTRVRIQDAAAFFVDHPAHWSANNADLLESDTVLGNVLEPMDRALRPPLALTTTKNVVIGSAGACTPLCYTHHHRTFLAVASGSVQVRLCPPRTTAQLHPRKGAAAATYESDVDPWSTDTDVKCVETELASGHMLAVPPYWWYSLRIVTPEASIVGLSYTTYMSAFSTLPDTLQRWLQQQNTRYQTYATKD